MISTERARIDDVYPDPNNPRGEFEGIADLAESFALNDGEPFTPPILRRDGGIYFVVDGERRLKAMQSIGTHEFTAIVCDTLDTANALLTMIATDDKQPLSVLEKSRGVQQMLECGVDPDKAAKAARIDREALYKVQAGRQFAADAAEDMTLDRLVWIGEHENYTADELAKVRDAEEKRWASVASSVEHEHEDTSIVLTRIAKLKVQGLTAIDGGRGCSPEIPDGYHEIAWASEPVCDKCIIAVNKAYWMDKPRETICCTIEHECPVVEDPAAIEREERARKHKEEEERWDWERKRRKDWLDQTLKDTPAVLNSLMEWSVKEAIILVFAEDYGIDAELDADELRKETFFEVCVRFGFGFIDGFMDYRIDDDTRSIYIELLDHMTACGYDLSDQEQARLQSEREKLAQQDEEEDEEEDGDE